MSQIRSNRRTVLATGLAMTGLAALPLTAFSPAALAQDDTLAEARQLLDRAASTVAAAKTDPSFGNAPELLRRAKGILVVPELVKGGFFVGGEGGRGVLMVRRGQGFAPPVFYTLGSASFGLQIGIQTAEVVLFLMSDGAVQGVLDDNFKLGAQASLAVVTVGSNVQAATGSGLNADIYVWARANGAYAGLTLEGTALDPADAYNRAVYGEAATAAEILAGKATPRVSAAGLAQAITS